MVARTVRNFGKMAGRGGDPGSRGGPAESATTVSAEGRAADEDGRIRGWRRCSGRSSRSRATTRRCTWSISATSWRSRVTRLIECRQLRLTYGYPLKIHCRLRSESGADLAEQAIYLGEMPVMIGGGEFIVNGADRVIVNQLHRSPGRRFPDREQGRRPRPARRPDHSRARKLDRDQRDPEGCSGRPDRPVQQDPGDGVPAGDGSGVRHDRRDPAAVLPDQDGHGQQADARPCGRSARSWTPRPARSSSRPARQIGDKVAVDPAERHQEGRGHRGGRDTIILNTLAEDDCESHEQALLKFYMRLRPGQPAEPGEGQGLLHREVLRCQPVSSGPGRPVPAEPQVQPEGR